MGKLSLEFEVVSPLLLYGADQQKPELRAPSIRGELRYWHRAVLGARHHDLKDVRAQETKLFGSTEQASTVTIRIRQDSQQSTHENPKTLMLPHKGKGLNTAIDTGSTFWVDLVARPGVGITSNAELMNTLSIWMLLGGLGRRSRRMFGGLYLSYTESAETPDLFEIPNWWQSDFQKPNDIVVAIKEQMSRVSSNLPTLKNKPIFPVLHPKHARIVVCSTPFKDITTAANALFGMKNQTLLHDSRYYKKSVFGGISPRRASPLIAQLRRAGNSLYIVLTAMSTDFTGADWSLMHSFLDDCQNELGGTTVWGEL